MKSVPRDVGRRLVAVVGAGGVGAALLLAAGAAPAGATTTAQVPAGASLITLGGPGDQTDPHVSGNLVAYTDFSSGTGQVIVHDLTTGTDTGIVTSDGSDALPDISGNTVSFVHGDATGAQLAYRYDYPNGPGTAAPADSELAADHVRFARVGGSTFLFQDFGVSAAETPEIVGFDSATGVTTRLTDDGLYDRDPAVSQDGRTALWTKCATGTNPYATTNCHIWQASHGASAWSAPQQLTSVGEQAHPDTDGRYVVYSTGASGAAWTDQHIAWQPVGGGPEHVLDVTGNDPSISNGVIVFDEVDVNQNVGVWLYDIATDTLYKLSDALGESFLPHVSVTADRAVTAAWTQTSLTGEDNVKVERFQLPAVADTVTLSPATGSGQVGTSHTVKAAVTSGGSAIAGVPVQVAVTGAVSTTASCTTDSTGACSVTYQGPSTPGSDTITAYADTNGDGSRDNGEPQGTAAWTWEDTASTPGDAAGAGQIAGPHGRVSFLFGVHSDGRSPIGGCLVTDPGSRVTITCTDVTRFVETGTSVRIEGHASVNGTRTTYTISAQDGGTRGRGDTFGIQTASGYSANGSLTSGDVLVH